MRFNCGVDVVLDADDSVQVGFRPVGAGAWKWSDPRPVHTPSDHVDIMLYNFTPGISYQYKVRLVDADISTSAAGLGTPQLPARLADLKLTTSHTSACKTNYVLFDMVDFCNGSPNLKYLIAVRVNDGAIVWYQDIYAATGSYGQINGWSINDDDPMFPILLVIVDQTYLYQMALDGTTTLVEDFSADCSAASTDAGPCPHHDVFYCADNGKTYLLLS